MVQEATHEAGLGPLKGEVSAQKGPRRRGEVAGRNGREQLLLDWGSMICLEGKSIKSFFMLKEIETIGVIGQTCYILRQMASH